MKKIVFFCHNFGGFGHNRRIYSIIKILIDKFDYFVILINSGENQNFLFNNLKLLKIINLPIYDYKGFSIIKNENYIKVLELRKKYYKKIFEIENIEKIVIEHFPFGRLDLKDEINEFINIFKSKFPNGQIFGSVRDICETGKTNQNYINIFDRILVHSDEKIINLNKIPSKYLKNIVYTGFVVEKINFRRSKTNNIVINIGGGTDGFEYLKKFLILIKNIENFQDYKFIISLGNQYCNENISQIKSIINTNIVIKKYIHNLLKYKINSVLSVSMGGYNNLVECLKYGYNGIINSRQKDGEQTKRLKIFKKYCTNIIDANTLTLQKIQQVLNDNTIIKNKNIDFDGAYFSASFISNFGKYKYIKIRPSNICNAKCDMCGVIKRKKKSNKPEKIKQCIEAFYKIGGKIVNLTGGEPTIFKGFWDILKLSKNLDLKVSVSTNGSTLGDDFFKKLYYKKNKLIDFIDISIDGLSDKHNKFRKYDGLFENIVSNIKKILENKIFLHINFTIRKENILDSYKMFEYFKNLGVKSISFGMIDDSPINNTSNLIPKIDDLKIFYEKIVPEIKKYSNGIDMKISPSLEYFVGTKNEFYNNILNGNNFKHKFGEKCNYIFSKNQIRINEGGSISPCCEIDDFDENLGNINKQSLLKIICSEKYEKFLNLRFPEISNACKNCKINFS